MTPASKVPPTFIYRSDPEEIACSQCWPSWMAQGVGPPSFSCCITSENQLFATPWTVAYQAPPSVGFSRQEYWSGLPCPSPGELSDPGIEPRSPASQADALPSELPGKPNSENQWMWLYHIRPSWGAMALRQSCHMHSLRKVPDISFILSK